MAVTPVIPSGSTNGKQIKIAAISTPGTLLHTAVAGTTSIDEVWGWVINNDTVSRNLALEIGGVASPDDLIQLAVPSKTGLYLVIPGLRLNNGAEIRAFASVADVLSMDIVVNRYVP